MGTRRFLTSRGPDGERGAMLVLAAISMVVVLGSTALAVDLNKIVATKRTLQEAVDLASLDAVRALGDRRGQAPGLTPAQHATKLAREALKANGYDTSDPGVVTGFQVTLGRYDRTTRTLDPGGTPQDGAQVTVTIDRRFSFAPGNKTLTATGVSSVNSSAAIAVGSFLVRLGGQDTILDALLGGLLGGPLDLSLVSYTALATAQVTLGQIRDAMGLAVGTVNDLLSAPVTMAQVMAGLAGSLAGQGNAVASSALSTMAATASNPNANVIRLGDLITIAQNTGNAALDVGLNVLGLAQGVIEAANKAHFLAINIPTLGVPGVATASLEATVVEPPKLAIGPPRQIGGQWVTRAQTAQIRLLLRVSVLNGAVLLPIYIESGSALAELTGITCATPIQNSQIGVKVTRSALKAYIGNVTQADMTDLAAGVTVSPAPLISVPLLGAISVYAAATVAAGTDNFITGPNLGWTAPNKTVGSSSLNLGSLLTSLQLSNGGGLLGAITGLVWALVGPVLQPVLDALSSVLGVVDSLLDPILGALGVLLGGADVWAWHLECNGRTLVR